MKANNPVVDTFITAINNGDRAAFLATLASDATMSDDGAERELKQWIDREIFEVHGGFTIVEQDPDGLGLVARFRNDTWGAMRTRWRFELSGDGATIKRFETGQD